MQPHLAIFLSNLLSARTLKMSQKLCMCHATQRLTSAPNHSCPARFSCITSSGNLTRKSRLARSFGMISSIISMQMLRTCEVAQLSDNTVPLLFTVQIPQTEHDQQFSVNLNKYLSLAVLSYGKFCRFYSTT